jgi:glycosyl transferase family 25
MKISPIPIYVVNLKKREDRLHTTLLELQNIFDIKKVKVNLIEAQYSPRNGAIGCSSSHAFAISKFLHETDAPAGLFIEDDFQCLDPIYFINTLDKILSLPSKWDVALLAHNQAFKQAPTDHANIFKILNAQTTSAYIVNRVYAPNLIQLFFKSSNLLSTSVGHIENSNSNYLFALDMLWKNEQINNFFIAPFPPCSIQRESFSDIENRNVNYGV